MRDGKQKFGDYKVDAVTCMRIPNPIIKSKPNRSNHI